MRNENVDSDFSDELVSMLGARRDRTAGAESSRGLLLTILGEFVLPTGGSAWTQTLVAALGLVGVQEKAARQALARMEADGWLCRERVGRRTRWSLADGTYDLLTEGADRIYGFGRHARSWDGEWVVLLASVPESDRASRYRMAQRLSWLGFGPLGHGTWICPWVEQEQAARPVIEALEVDATSFRGPVGLFGSGAELVRQAWPVAELAAAYREFLDEFPVELSGQSARSPEDAARHLVRLVHEWRRFPLLDPDLPTELLPDDWPGRLTSERFAALRAASAGGALAWWREQEGDEPT